LATIFITALEERDIKRPSGVVALPAPLILLSDLSSILLLLLLLPPPPPSPLLLLKDFILKNVILLNSVGDGTRPPSVTVLLLLMKWSSTIRLESVVGLLPLAGERDCERLMGVLLEALVVEVVALGVVRKEEEEEEEEEEGGRGRLSDLWMVGRNLSTRKGDESAVFVVL